MTLNAIETTRREQTPWEKLVKPETPEQPLIRVYKNIERECFEASFALELAGIGKRPTSRKENKERGEQQENNHHHYKKLLLAGLTVGQTLDFEYAGGRTRQGKAFFDWTIKGRAEGDTSDTAADSARQLWQNLHVITGTLKSGYAFSPILDEKKLRTSPQDAGWTASIERTGVAVNTHSYKPMGFLRAEKNQRDMEGVIVAPERFEGRAQNFDTLGAGATGCPANVTLVLSITRVELGDDHMKTIASALKWLRNGEAKQISFQEGLSEGSDNKELLASLDSSLELWLGSRAGYRVSCIARSKEPIPMAFLKLMGTELFAGPFSIVTGGRVKDSKVQETMNAVKEDTHFLDLRNYINSINLLPPLFPSIETLHASNVKRSYLNTVGEMAEKGLLLGTIGKQANAKPIYFSEQDRSRHAYVVGSTGTGKSTLLFNMIRQDIENNEGVCVIDPHGDLFKQVLTIIPKERAEDVVIVDPGDFDRVVGINFLETNGENKSVQMNFVVNEMIKIFDRLYDLKTTGGPIFEQYMRNAMLLLMDNEYTQGTLTDIPLLFEDSQFRKFLKKGCRNPMVESFWTNQAEEAGGEASLRNIAPYITSKLNQFVHNALLRPIIGQPESTINFRDAMDKGKILLVNLSKGTLGELDSSLLGMLIIGKIFSAAMGRVNMPFEARKRFYVYIDEFQNFATDSIPYLLSEVRKYGIGLTLANQNLSQLRSRNGEQSILDAVLGNVGSAFMMRLGIIDSDIMKTYTEPELNGHDLQNLPDYQVAARLLNKNAPMKPFVFNTMPAQDGNAYLASRIRTLSRLKFANDRALVESDIIIRRKSYKQEKAVSLVKEL